MEVIYKFIYNPSNKRMLKVLYRVLSKDPYTTQYERDFITISIHAYFSILSIRYQKYRSSTKAIIVTQQHMLRISGRRFYTICIPFFFFSGNNTEKIFLEHLFSMPAIYCNSNMMKPYWVIVIISRNLRREIFLIYSFHVYLC